MDSVAVFCAESPVSPPQNHCDGSHSDSVYWPPFWVPGTGLRRPSAKGIRHPKAQMKAWVPLIGLEGSSGRVSRHPKPHICQLARLKRRNQMDSSGCGKS